MSTGDRLRELKNELVIKIRQEVPLRKAVLEARITDDSNLWLIIDRDGYNKENQLLEVSSLYIDLPSEELCSLLNEMEDNTDDRLLDFLAKCINEAVPEWNDKVCYAKDMIGNDAKSFHFAEVEE
ncbi:MAG: hypothetical protein WBI07_17850 [Mobilitalea sp.]